jgi:hypothetical protein
VNDTEGNWNTLSDFITVRDTNQPLLTNLVESADPLELGQTETIQINATDLSGISRVLIEISGLNYTMTKISSATWEYNSWTPTTAGLKSYTIYANDTEGNWNSESDTIMVNTQGGDENNGMTDENFDSIVIFSTFGVLGVLAVVLVNSLRPKRFLK